MKKLFALLLMFIVLGSNEIFAIGLPNNAYTHKYASINSGVSNEKATTTKTKLLAGQVRDGYADDHANTLDAPSNLQDFTQAIVNRIVGFVSMILLSLASFGSSLADGIYAANTWTITDLPPRV